MNDTLLDSDIAGQPLLSDLIYELNRDPRWRDYHVCGHGSTTSWGA